MKKLDIKYVNKENVKCSEFGCVNCLWAGVECKEQEKFEAKVFNGQASCKGYTYCD